MADELASITSAEILDVEIKRITLEKLRAERERPVAEQYFPNRVISAVPLLTIGVTLASLLGGGIGYLYDKHSQRVLLSQQILRQHSEKIFNFTTRTEIHTSEIIYIIRDLFEIVSSDDARKAAITSAALELFHNQANYDRTRDAIFLRIMFEHWPPMAAAARNENKIEFILYKLKRSIEKIALSDPSYFKTMRYDSKLGSYRVGRYTDEERYIHFVTLVSAARVMLDVASNDEIKSRFRKEFGDTLQNPSLAGELFF